MRERDRWFGGGFTFPFVMKNTIGRGAEIVPGFPQDRPTLEQFADTPLKRAVLDLHNNSRPGSSVFFAPKGIPEQALRELNQAFEKVWKDPEFNRDYEKLTGEPADPITGKDIDRALAAIPKDPKIIEVYQQIIGGGSLPQSR